MKLRVLLFAVLLSPPVFADRWLILPPRTEGEAAASLNGPDLARQMALYLRISRVGEIVSVTEAEGCLKQANLSMSGKIRPEELRVVAQACHAERMLLTRIRRKSGEFEVTTKVYFRESDRLTDTLVTSGSTLHPLLGSHLSERFGKTPATPKESSADLIIAGDTYGGVYFDWTALKSFFLGLDWVKSAYCLIDSRGKLQSAKLKSDRANLKEFVERLRFEGSGFYGEGEALVHCAESAAHEARREGRRPIVVFLASESPRENRQQINLRAALRRLARQAKVIIAPASTTHETAQKFWSGIARELAENSVYLPLAQKARVGLASGQEWYIFRRNGRLYESRDAEPKEFKSGVRIPDKDAELVNPSDLIPLYEKLSKNKVVSPGKPTVDAAQLTQNLVNAFRSNDSEGAAWRVLLNQGGQNYYLSLGARDAQTLKPDTFARIYTELKNPTDSEIIRNRPSPTLVIGEAKDSAPGLELNVAEYIREPRKFLRKSMGGRSFYIFTGKVVQIIPPDTDAMDSGF